MEVRRPKISPKELVPFSRKSLYYQVPPILLPCPPHRISPLWKQSNRSVTKQISRINHLSRILKQSSAPCSWTKTSPSPWLQRLVTNPQVPHSYRKPVVAPSGHLQHPATAKSSTLHRRHPLASAKPFPRASTGTRKTDVSLKADKQHLTLLLSSKHQPESPLHPDHQTIGSSGLYSHFPKIYRCHNQPVEKLPTSNQKSLIPPFSNHQTTEDPPCEDHRAKAKAIHSTFPDSQDLATPATMSPGHRDETSLKSRQSFIRRKHVIIIPSCDNQYYSWATAFESPSEAQPSKTSHPNLCPRETASLLRWADHQTPRALGVSPSHLGQRTREASAPSPKAQAENILTPSAQAPFPMEVECWEVTPSKTDHQVVVVTAQDHGATSPLVLGPPDKTLLGLDYLDDASQLNLKWLVKEFEHWKVMPPRTRHHAAAQTGPDYGKAPPLGTEEKILPDPNQEVTTDTSADHQVKDISYLVSQGEVNVSTQTEEYWETTLLETDHQSTVLDQDHKTTPLMSSVSQDITLPGFHQAPYPPDCDHQLEAVPDPNTQVSFPPEYIKLSGGPEHQFIPSPTLPNHENQDKSVSDCIDYQQNHTPPISLNDQETAQPRPNCRTRSPPGPNHQTLDPNYQDQVQNGLQQQARNVPKRQGPWGFNYIKPYVIEGGSVPAKIVHSIINSIPQGKIKNDMSKKILLWKIEESPTHWPDQFFSSNYMVCLICASWIPYGCPHAQKSKYPCVTQLLAIPVLLPGSKQKLNVKFVFQVPQTTACNIFSLPYTHYCLQRPLHRPSTFPTSSHSDPVLSEPAKKKWLHFILGKNHQQGGKATIRSRQPCIKEMPRKRRRSARGGPRGLKQRGN